VIHEGEFKKILGELCGLCGIRKPDQEQGSLFYGKLANYELKDVREAFTDEELLANMARARVLVYPWMRERIEFYRNKRKNAEWEALKKREQREISADALTEAQIKKLIKDVIKKYER